MKGLILCGGEAKRLGSLTQSSNKHLLPVYSKPMVYYPIETLVKAGIKEIMIVVSGEYAGNFIKLLKNGEEFGLDKLVYAYQTGSKGIADALRLAKGFAGDEPLVVVLGDNTTDSEILPDIENFKKSKKGCGLFLKQVPDPERFGCPRFENGRLVEVIEKPKDPPSDKAVTGLYIFDNKIFDYVEKCELSERNEYEIATCINQYIKNDDVFHTELKGFWKDAGTVDNLFLANNYWYLVSKNKGK